MCHLQVHKLPLKISVTITRVYHFMHWKMCFWKRYIRWDKDERQACRQCNWVDVSWFQRIIISSSETSILILLMKTNKIWDEGSLFPSLIKEMFDLMVHWIYFVPTQTCSHRIWAAGNVANSSFSLPTFQGTHCRKFFCL